VTKVYKKMDERAKKWEDNKQQRKTWRWLNEVYLRKVIYFQFGGDINNNYMDMLDTVDNGCRDDKKNTLHNEEGDILVKFTTFG
jgi:hypothetical protein